MDALRHRDQGSFRAGFGHLALAHGSVRAGDHKRKADLQTQLVSQGQSVRKGQKIATMGSTGTDRVHLNFEIRRNDRRVNPALYLRGL